MPKNNAYDFPTDFYDFAMMPRFDESLETLRNLAEPEDWKYKNTEATHPNPILRNYINYTYQRIAEEKSWQLPRMKNFVAGTRV